MEAPNTNLQKVASSTPANPEEKGAIGIAFLVWLFGGGLGIAIVVFILLKLF